jgi:DNA-directed RNA polymerase specialized sigma54-like protein
VETIQQAVQTIAKALREDADYHHGWQSNIAVTLIDGVERAGYRLPNLHDIANKAAQDFLAQLMRNAEGG